MTHYNHFANQIYKQIRFSEVGIGEKFRMDKFRNGRRRLDIIMIKTGRFSYKEQKSKKEFALYGSNFDVSSYAIKHTT